tara:strand:- start:251330 stop:251761 length:432 start_codon:yes stop_codon:yes gene_type:complete
MQQHLFKSLPILLLTMLLSACVAMNAPQYDTQFDKELTQIQRQVDTLFAEIKVHLGKPAANYQHYILEYRQIDVSLQLLLTRADATAHNQHTIHQVKLLQSSMDKLQQRHKLGFKNAKELASLHTLINSQIQSILTLELAKPR